MSAYNLTLCDICALGKIPAMNRGYALVEPWYTLEKLGWTETDVGHICPTCIAEQKERAARDLDEEAETRNGVAVSLEEGLAQLDRDEAKLLAPEARAAIETAIATTPPGLLLSTTYEEWVQETKQAYAAARTSLRKSFGQSTPI